MAQRFKALRDHSGLLRHLVVTNLRLRYHGTFFGFFWTVLNAFAMITIFTFVFSYILRVQIRAFPVFVFCGYVPWLFFSSSLINSCYSLYRSQALMEETYFPREIPVIA
ncbi:MAG: hypothetical protein PHQ23_16365, partial [Candidatus Wallbacteria bacterium]|nr:hypothetical protein [Candidatus Wallbacteria bacterium]